MLVPYRWICTKAGKLSSNMLQLNFLIHVLLELNHMTSKRKEKSLGEENETMLVISSQGMGIIYLPQTCF